jgi:hypothetical protein
LNFTTLGLVVGQVIKIGGTLTAFRFNAAANNAFVRVIAITANALTLDNLPSGWAVDAGAGKTIRIWAGDQIKNGVTPNSLTMEAGFLGQPAPTYIVANGLQANTMQFMFANKDKIKSSVAFLGLGGSQSTVTLDAAPDLETTSPIMAANPDFKRFTETGATAVGPDFIRSADATINNNLRTIETIGSISPVGLIPGECTVSGKAEFYFGSGALTLAKFYAGTPASIMMASAKQNKGIVFQFPRITYRGGTNPTATAKNTDVMIALDWQASKDPLTQSQMIVDRMEYVEV